MHWEKWNYPLTLLANIGVVIGLIFLVVEIRQNQQIAGAQTRFEVGAFWRGLDEARQDSEFAQVFARSLNAPGELTLAERVQLDAYYWGYLDQLYNIDQALRSGVREGGIEEPVRVVVSLYMSNRYAHAWWRSMKGTLSYDERNQRVHRALDAAISAQDLGEDPYTYPGYDPVL